ncbi:MAG: hypothetical protein EXS27_03850 [Pedosphaera sp.]|nr:hypothetical protein [Pedosphaera sp.]
MSSTAHTANIPTPFRLLLRIHLLQMRRKFRSARDQSSLLVGALIVFLTGYTILASGLFYRALHFAGRFPGLGEMLIERMIYLLFSFLFLLLLFSNIVIGYTNLFRNKETAFLITLPISAQDIFRWKFLESALLASWAFLLLIAPLLGAYGLEQNAPWHFYLLGPVLIALFIVLPAVFGCWVAITIARHLDRRLFQLLTVLVVLLTFIGLSAYWKPQVLDEENLETRVISVLDRLLTKTRFSQFPFLPSYWLSSGVLHWVEGALSAAVFFVLVLLSNVGFFGLLAFTKTGRFFYSALSATHSRSHVLGQWEWFRNWTALRRQFHYRAGAMEYLLRLVPRLEPDTRALLLKDMRVFWRDTAQWGQTLVLFALIGVYISNLRYFTQQLANPFWVHLISYMNLAACSLNLATLTTRFVFPQFSLEGKRLWIVGLAPLGLVRVVKAKLLLSITASLIVTLPLIWISCDMLKLPLAQKFYFAGAIIVMTFTLNTLAIGLGALYPNMKEDQPSKIVSGFGGTFCLVLSFLYIVASVLLLSFGSPWGGMDFLTPNFKVLGWIGFAVLSVALGWLPYRWGLHRVATFEH